MSIQVMALENINAETHAAQIEQAMNEGYDYIVSHVHYLMDDTYTFTTFMKRGSRDGSINKASAIESLERRIKRLERLLKQVTTMLEGSIDDEAAPTRWVEDYMDMLKITRNSTGGQFIPLDRVGVVELALREDEERGE